MISCKNIEMEYTLYWYMQVVSVSLCIADNESGRICSNEEALLRTLLELPPTLTTAQQPQQHCRPSWNTSGNLFFRGSDRVMLRFPVT